MKTSSFHSRPRGAQGPAISLAGLSPRAVADWWPPICRTAWSQPSSWPDSLVTHFFPGISMGSSVYCLLTPEVHQLPTPETSRPAAIPASPKSTTLPQPSDLDSSPPTADPPIFTPSCHRPRLLGIVAAHDALHRGRRGGAALHGAEDAIEAA